MTRRPLCEEWVFRACIVPLLVASGCSFGVTVLASPVLFGCAHVHHLIEHVRKRGLPLRQGITIVAFQLAYTTLFGVYATFLFVRTGHLVAAFAAHAFCNTMGFPDLSWTRADSEHASRKHWIALAYLVGIVAFGALLYPLTEPRMYESWFVQLLARVSRHASESSVQ